MVEADSFKEIVLTGNSDKKVMTRVTLGKKITEKFEQMTSNLKEHFEKADVICITADIWSCATRSFIGKLQNLAYRFGEFCIFEIIQGSRLIGSPNATWPVIKLLSGARG